MQKIVTASGKDYLDVALRYSILSVLLLAVSVLVISFFWLRDITLLIYEAPADAWYLPQLAGREELGMRFYEEKLLRYIAKLLGMLLILGVSLFFIRLGRQSIGLAAVCSSVLLVGIAAEVLLCFLVAQPKIALKLGMASIGSAVVDLPAIQYEPDCTRYDDELTYTLKPGKCVFDSSESVNEYKVNSAGLRDSEDALVAPEIILLGDSFAMGWGVEQDETISAYLSRQIGRRVLNAGISSYGTVRELRLLDRLDTSALQILIILYIPHGQAGNDFYENKEFVQRGHQLEIMSAQEFQQIQEEYLTAKESYIPGSYLAEALTLVGESWFLPKDFASDAGSHLIGEVRYPEARIFLEVLARASSVDLTGVRILVLEPTGQSSFPTRLAEYLNSEVNSPYAEQIEVVDVSGKMDDEDFFVYDPHLTAEGNRKIAGHIAEHLKN